jgi:hypothetical protein
MPIPISHPASPFHFDFQNTHILENKTEKANNLFAHGSSPSRAPFQNNNFGSSLWWNEFGQNLDANVE